MNYSEFKNTLLACADDLIEREQELSQLDSYVGDGDHGVTIRKAYMNIRKSVEDENPADISGILMSGAMALANTAGGAIGPILSTFYMGMSISVMGKDELGVSDLAEMFAAGLASIQDMGGAKPGDRTMVDALYPAVEALKNTTATDVKTAMTEAADKAYEGAQATAGMVAKLGRAKNLGERSLGYVDAGSMSTYYFFRAFADNL